MSARTNIASTPISPLPTHIQVVSGVGPMVVSLADHVLSLVHSAATLHEKQRLIEQAKIIDDNCPNVHFMAAEISEQQIPKYLALKRALDLSFELWGSFEEHHEVTFWRDIGTRPMLKGFFDMIALSVEADHVEIAHQYLGILLEFDAADHYHAASLIPSSPAP